MPREPWLDFLGGLHAVLLHELFAPGAFVPEGARTLIAADVDDLGRERLAHPVDRPFGELQRFGIPHAQHVRTLLRLHGTGEVRIGSRNRAGVSREVELRHDGDVPRLRVGEDVAHVVRGIEERLLVSAKARECALPRQVRVFGKVDAPAPFVREMPVEHVELVARHQVEHPPDRPLAEEPLRLAEMNAAPLERGRVLDLHARIPDVRPVRGLHGQLGERHAGVERTCVICAAYRYAVRRDRQFISLRRNGRVDLHLRRGLYMALAARDEHFPRCGNQRNRHIPARGSRGLVRLGRCNNGDGHDDFRNQFLHFRLSFQRLSFYRGFD